MMPEPRALATNEADDSLHNKRVDRFWRFPMKLTNLVVAALLALVMPAVAQ
jgi:hypothetical protein